MGRNSTTGVSRKGTIIRKERGATFTLAICTEVITIFSNMSPYSDIYYIIRKFTLLKNLHNFDNFSI